MVLIALWFVLYATFALVTPPLLDDADSVHAEVAREMVQRHDPVTLYANGIRYLEKAPLLYWSMAASFRLFGVHAAAARLPLALYVLALLLTVEGLGRRIFRSARVGFYAALILLSSFGLFIFTRILIPDAIVCLWLTLALAAFWHTEEQPRPTLAPCLLFGIACALNILTKGLIGLVFPLGIVLLYLLVTRGVKGTANRLLQLHLVPTLLVFLAVAAPWHILAGLHNPTEGHPLGLNHLGGHWNVPLPTLGNVHGWTWFYFMNEHVLRYLNLRVPRDYDTVPLVLFWGLILIWLMPWSAFLFKAIASVPWRNALRRKGMNEEGRARLLLGVWALLPLVFFSFSTRQEYYVLPALPAFALLIAKWLHDEARQAEEFQLPGGLVTAGQHISVVLLVCGSTAAIACTFFVLHAKPPSPGLDLAALLQQNPGDYALSFGHFLDLNAQAMGAFRVPLVLTAVALFFGSYACWWARRRYKPHVANLALAGMAYLFLIAAHMGLQIFSPVLTSQTHALAIAREIRRGDLIVLNDEYEAASTLGFYLQRPGPNGGEPIHILHGHSANLWYGSFFSDAPKIFEDDASFLQKWTGPQRIFLWTEAGKAPSLPAQAFVISDGGGKQILSNKMNKK
ncbi:phospholipid carrier-dependent glycosyltransferase [Terriglobus saanensis]|uniref:phospholipid carrier-dependent glycosyltransferase n=1 Tax=Terriglobus saanensis TaxID=870903 RepID=UPI0001E505C7|nr:phospholipid carrier-dependent glycosyltransferase [Terriglobus saanensis]